MNRRLLPLLLAFGCGRAAAPPTRTAVEALDSPDVTWVHELVNDPIGTAGDGNSVRGALIELDGRWYGLAGERGPNQGGSPGAPCNSGANWSTTEHRNRCPGTLFSVGPGGDLRVEHAFTQIDDAGHNPDGYHPYGSLVAGPGGWLYGVTQMGGAPPIAGARGSGVLFRYQPSTSTFSVLHHFFSTTRAFDGIYPMGAPASLPDGRVCGTAKEGGEFSGGAVWCWSESGFAYAGIPTSVGGAVGGVTYARGRLHGVSSWGGANGVGTYFTVEPDALSVTVVDSFPAFVAPSCCNDNTSIQSPTLLSNGDLVVARQFGGANGTGLIARLEPTRIVVLLQFDAVAPNVPGPVIRFSNTTGAMPNGQIAEGCDGLIYGTTMYGGTEGAGTVYRFPRDGSWSQVVRSFSLGGPSYPYGGLARGSDCALWGTTFLVGRVFRFVPPQAVCP